MNSRRVVLAWLTLLALTARADEGHDHAHGDEPSVQVAGVGPQRLPDGSVWLPKPAQRLYAVRTLPVAAARLARTVELAGRVVVDPNAGGPVQPMQAGRIEPGPSGLPQLGQRVRKGEVLAYVRLASSAVDRSSQEVQAAELQAAAVRVDRQLARLQGMAGVVPQKEIDEAQTELSGLRRRLAALQAGLTAREPLTAPVTGVIAAANVQAGQVVDARERVFEVIDPARLQIEAMAYEPALAGEMASGSVVVGPERVPLRLLGVGRQLREQALPVLFAADGPALHRLAVGTPLPVLVHLRSTLDGLGVPVAALMKTPANQAIVWVKTAPERFEPRPVRVAPLDGGRVAVTHGLQPGERVVVQGAALINQIR